MKIERAVYSFLRKVIAPCNKHISFKFSFKLIDVTRRITKKGVSKTEVPALGVCKKKSLTDLMCPLISSMRCLTPS